MYPSERSCSIISWSTALSATTSPTLWSGRPIPSYDGTVRQNDHRGVRSQRPEHLPQQAILETVVRLHGAVILCVLLLGGHRHPGRHEMGEAVADLVDALVVDGEEGRLAARQDVEPD